jgi:hypothetical protein
MITPTARMITKIPKMSIAPHSLFLIWRRQLDKLAHDVRKIAPELATPLVGRDAICLWLYRHGFRGRCNKPPRWPTVLEWQKRAGQPFLFHRPHIGRCRGQPVTTPAILLAWCMVQAPKFGPPTDARFVPGSNARHKRRKAAAQLDAKAK